MMAARPGAPARKARPGGWPRGRSPATKKATVTKKATTKHATTKRATAKKAPPRRRPRLRATAKKATTKRTPARRPLPKTAAQKGRPPRRGRQGRRAVGHRPAPRGRRGPIVRAQRPPAAAPAAWAGRSRPCASPPGTSTRSRRALRRVSRLARHARSPTSLCMQETKLADAAFPALDVPALGYDSVHHGEGRWNGVAILSRVGLEDPVAGFADGEPADDEARLVSATCGGVRVSTVYVPNGRSLDHEQYQLQAAPGWRRLRAHLEADARRRATRGRVRRLQHRARRPRRVRPGAVRGRHPRQPEPSGPRSPSWRLGPASTSSAQHYPDVDGLYCWWDYRAGNFHKHRGMRIDLVLLSRRSGRPRAPGRSSTATPARAQAQRPRPAVRRRRHSRASSEDADGMPDRPIRPELAAPGSPGWPALLSELADAEPSPRRAELHRTGEALRRIVHRLHGSPAPDGELAAAADELEALADRLRRAPRRVAVRGVRRVAAGAGEIRTVLRPQPDARPGQPAGPADRARGRRTT